MSKFFQLSLLLTSFAATHSFAQSNAGKISGSVSDNNQKAIPSVTISLLKSIDSSVIKFTVTDKKGEYIIENIADGKYIILATSVGFDKKYSDVFGISVTDQAISIPTLKMNQLFRGLGNVTVTAVKPFIEAKVDKMVVNVDASPTSAGATAMEVLEKSPGIMVSNDGIISLRGKSGVIIMMDGKPTFLSPGDLANLLKNLPASAIEQIEIMTNPSSKYDASGNAGVINIKTKKGKAAGFNGSIMVGGTAGLYSDKTSFYVTPRSQNSITFNYRKNKINFFGNYNPNINRGMALLEITRKFIQPGGTVTGYSDVQTKFKFGNNNHTLKLGLDYYANKKNTFGIVTSGFTFSGHPTPTTNTVISNAAHQPQSQMLSLTKNKLKFQNFTSNFNYRHTFDSTDRELTADLDFVVYNNTSNMMLSTGFFNGAGQPTGSDLLLKGRLPSNIKIYSLKSDYVHPFAKGGRLEAGIKSSYVKNDNIVEYERWDGNKWTNDNRSNHFKYDENINALYLNGNKQVKKWTFQGGLRLENTITRGYQVTNDSSFKRNFTNLFPSAFVSYAINKSNSVTVSYSRRITRPDYEDLNPFTYFLDSLSYRKGNPFLLPQFTHNIEVSHSYKGKLITTLNYSNTTDVISEILKVEKQNGQDIVFLTSDNVAKFRNIGISITAPLPVTRWWNANLFTNIYNNHYKGFYNADPLDVSFTSFMINISNTFTLKQGFTIEVSGWYRAKRAEDLNISDPMYIINLGSQKVVLKGKGTVRLNFRDPFWLQKYAGSTRYSTIDVQVKNRWDNRQVTATFTYRFGKSAQQNQQRRRNASSLEEQNRVNSSNQQ